MNQSQAGGKAQEERSAIPMLWCARGCSASGGERCVPHELPLLTERALEATRRGYPHR